NSRDPKVLQTIARAFQRLGTDHVWLGEAAEIEGNTAAAVGYYEKAIPFHENMVSAVEQLAAVEKNVSESRRIKIAAYSSIAESLASAARVDEALQFAKNAL